MASFQAKLNRFFSSLNEEIQDFLNYIKPRPEEDAIRRDVVERVKAVIKQLWPQAKVGKHLDQYLYTTITLNLRIISLHNL